MSHTIPSLAQFRLLALPDTSQMERWVKDFLASNRRWPDFIQEFQNSMLTGSYKLGVSYSQWSNRVFVTDGEGLPEITFNGDPDSVLVVYGPYVLRNNNVQFQGISGFFRLKNSTTSGSESDLQDLWTGIQNLETNKVSNQTLDESISSVNNKFVNYPTKLDLENRVSNISLTPGPRGVPGPSAYNEWLLEGNTGSFEEFLETIKGPKGEDGTGVTILGSFETVEELPSTSQSGDGYLVSGDLYVWNEENSNWTNVGTIQGPQGEIGPKGNQGNSAYQVWLSQGNSGTEADYLASLEGEPGTTLHSELTDSEEGDFHPQYLNEQRGDQRYPAGDPSSPQNSQVWTYDGVSGGWLPKNIPAAPVSSVNSKTGDVALGYSDVGAAPSSHVGSRDGHPLATTTENGFLASSDKQKLDAFKEASYIKLGINSGTSFDVASSTWTKIPYNHHSFSKGSFLSSSSGGIRVLKEGCFDVKALFYLSGGYITPDSFYILMLYRNGSSESRLNTQHSSVSAQLALGGGSLVQCSANDLLEVYLFQSSGSTISFNSSALDSTNQLFSASLVG